MNTKYENLKARVIEFFNTLLNSHENDIESGIADGTYKTEENVDTRNFIKDAKQVIADFEKYQPEIYMYIEGFQIQGISGTEKISINKLDMYDFKQAPEEQEMTPEEWDQMITEKTNNLEIKKIKRNARKISQRLVSYLHINISEANNKFDPLSSFKY